MAALYLLLALLLSVGNATGGRYKSLENDEDAIDTSSSTFPYGSLRLPGDVVPEEYKLLLHPNITDGTFKVTGSVKIYLNVLKETDSIILHSKSLVHVLTRVFEVDSGEIPVRDVLTHQKHELVMVRLGSKLSTEKKYVLYIMFAGELSKGLRGFYRSSYKAGDGQTRYLATSHFEPTGARLAFPCFDEPAMKAKFSIRIVREKIHTALSNMPIDSTVTRSDGLLEDRFMKSVKMSTYLVAFIVSDFAHLSTKSSRGVKINVWAPKHLVSQASYAIEVTPKILDYYEKFFKVDFPLPKQDLIAIPDFAAGAMENWGLITYRLTALLYDEKQSSSANKQRVVEVIAHELAHQWFGNLVTMKWWNDLWLNEGFARFVQFIGTSVVTESWELMDQFVHDNLQRALALDSRLNSHPISVPVSDPNDIGGLFDGISYSKGASIIRMMRDFIGAGRFVNGLAAYLKKNKFGNAVSDDLWASLSAATDHKINVKEIMDTWTLQMGYPVVNVIRTSKDVAMITQERFVTDVGKGETKSPFNYKWEVPVTFYFQNKRDKQLTWMHLKDDSVKMSWPQQNGWLKVNADEIGFYRVNYDTENWKALNDQLESDHQQLSPADRSNLLDDAFALASTGMLTYEQALDLTKYLVKEKHYVPCATAYSVLGKIGGLLHNRPGYAKYESYLLELLTPLVNELGWKDEGTHLNKFLRSLVLSTAVKHKMSDAVINTKKMYKAWMEGKKSIPANLRSAVYLAGIKYGGEDEWNFMYAKYQSSIYPSEKRTLMYTLATTTNVKTLKWYLENSINTDVIRSQDTCSMLSRIAANPIGTKMVREFVKKHWKLLYDRYGHGDGLSGVVSGVFGSGKTQAELKEAEEFLGTHELGSAKLSAKRTLAAIHNNINWLAKNEKSVVGWLNKKL